MTIKEIIKIYSQKLKKLSGSPILDIEILLCAVLKKPKEYLFTNPNKTISHTPYAQFQLLFKKRQKGWPIAYLTGHKEFYGLDFIVNKNVLIPRPETELLVDEVLKYIRLSKINNQQSTIIDIGTGSGCIAIALAKNLERFCHPELAEGRSSDKNASVIIYATDYSTTAIKTAKLNAQYNKVKINFLKGNLLNLPLPEGEKQRGWEISKIHNSQFAIRNSIITTNLPYLTKSEMKEPSIKFEPKSALYGGPDGLKYFKQFFKQIKKFNLQPQAIFFEIGYKQADQIKKLASSALPNYIFKVKKDLCGKDRLLILTPKT